MPATFYFLQLWHVAFNVKVTMDLYRLKSAIFLFVNLAQIQDAYNAQIPAMLLALNAILQQFWHQACVYQDAQV